MILQFLCVITLNFEHINLISAMLNYGYKTQFIITYGYTFLMFISADFFFKKSLPAVAETMENYMADAE